MGTKSSRPERSSNIACSLTNDDIFTIFLYIKTVSTGSNMFEKSESFKHLTREDLVSAIKTIVYNQNEIAKLSGSEPFKPRVRAYAQARYDSSDSEEFKPIIRSVTIDELAFY